MDDHAIFRKGIMSLLGESSDITIVSEASNGKEFIQQAFLHMPDIVLLDLEMPEMDGEATCRYLKRHIPQLKVLVLTSYEDAELAAHMAKLGIRGFICKGSNAETVVQAIHEVRTTGYYFNHIFTQEMLDQNVRLASASKAHLSQREKQIVTLLCKEYTNKEVADILSLSVRTVETHRDNIMKKIGATTLAGIVVYGIKNKLDRRRDFAHRNRRSASIPKS